MTPSGLFGLGGSSLMHEQERRPCWQEESNRQAAKPAARDELAAMVRKDPGLPMRMLLDPERRHEETPTGDTWATHALSTDENAARVVTLRPDLHRETVEPDGKGLTLLALALTSHPTLASQLAAEEPALLRQTVRLASEERAPTDSGDKGRDGQGRDAPVHGASEEGDPAEVAPTILEHLASRAVLTPFKDHPHLLRETDRRGDPLAFTMVLSRWLGTEGRDFLQHLLPLDPELIHLEDREGKKLWEALLETARLMAAAYIIEREELWALTSKRGRSALHMALALLVRTEPHEVSATSPFALVASESLDEALHHSAGEDEPQTMLTRLADEDPEALFERLWCGNVPALCHPRFLEEDGTGRTALDRILHDETCQQGILFSRNLRQLRFGGKTFVQHLIEAPGAPFSVRTQARALNALDRVLGMDDTVQTLEGPKQHGPRPTP